MNKVEIIAADITKLQVDAIVNAANSSLMGGGGVDGAIHRAAGPELAEACRALRGCATGLSKITPGFLLAAKFVIHTVGPVWYDGTKNEEKLLRSCYATAMQLALENHIKTIAFPAISTGANRFPFDKAARIAHQEMTTFLNANETIEKVMLVLYNEKDKARFEKALEKS